MNGYAQEDSLSGRLDAVEPALARLQRAAFCGRSVLRFHFAGAPFVLRFTQDDPEFTPALALLLRVGQTQGWLLLESYGLAGEEWAGVFEKLDPALVRALLIEEATQQLAALGAAIGEPVQLIDLQPGQTFVTRVTTQALRIDNEASGVGVRAALRSEDAGFFDRLTTALAAHPAHVAAASAEARLPLRISLGTAWLQQDDVRKSRAGDVLVFPARGELEAVHAWCTDRHGRRLPLQVLLSGSSGRLSYSDEEMMVSETNEMHTAPAGLAALGEMNVAVTAVVGELELPLRDIGALQAGYIFELPTSIEQATVQLYTGSRHVGSGRLVAIGDRLGVRLLEWGGAHNGNTA